MIFPWSVKSFLEIERLKGEVAFSEREKDRLQNDLDQLRVDHARLVEMMGGLATRPRIGAVMNSDPFAEAGGPDEWLTPQEDEVVDPTILKEKVANAE